MVNVVTKRIKGNEYIYLVESIRKGKQIIQKTIKYIGKKRPVTKEEFGCMEKSYLKEDWVLGDFREYLSYQDHNNMKNASKQYVKYLKGLDIVSRDKEKEKFLSNFIANSNAIEGSTMTVRETFNYLFKDITPPSHKKKELFMALNLLNAWDYVEKNHKRLPKKEDLLNLHKIVNKDIESIETLGKFKRVQNYVGDVWTTSFLFTEERINDFFKWIRGAYKKIDDFEVAFQSHAQFEIIHPFVDGNGRVGRLIMNWLLMYRDLSYFAIREKNTNAYYSALYNSQNGKVEAICKFCLKEYAGQYKFM